MLVTLINLFSKNLRDQLNFWKNYLNKSVRFLKYSTFWEKADLTLLLKSIAKKKDLWNIRNNVVIINSSPVLFCEKAVTG